MEKRPLTPLALALKRARAKAGVSQHALARMSGISRQTIANIETGIHETAKLDTLEAIAESLGCPVSDLSNKVPVTSPTAALIDGFAASHYGQITRPTDDELAWLRSLPEIVWIGGGGPPTDETFYHMILGLRAHSIKVKGET